MSRPNIMARYFCIQLRCRRIMEGPLVPWKQKTNNNFMLMILSFILRRCYKNISLLRKPAITNLLLRSKLKITSMMLFKLTNKSRRLRANRTVLKAKLSTMLSEDFLVKWKRDWMIRLMGTCAISCICLSRAFWKKRRILSFVEQEMLLRSPNFSMTW